MKLLIEGIKYNKSTDEFDFDWKADTPKDLINLKLQTYNKFISSKQGFNLYYAYKFNKTSDKDLKGLLRDSIKYVNSDLVKSDDIDLMLSKGINNLNQIEPLSSFDVIIFPKSTSKILDLLKIKLSAKAGNNTLVASDLFIKNTLDNIKLNQEKLDKLTPKNKDNTLKILNKVFSQESFQLKAIPPQYRKFIENFLSFNSETEKRIFNAITDGKVLLVDDILTEGTTFLNMAKLLENYGVNSITGFILLTNK
jgi:phosphoribosylpyrophosphate synthetase